MLKKIQPTYEVSFLERHVEEGVVGSHWVSAAVSGFKGGSSRHEQVEKILGKIGNPVIEGDFKMRRMRVEELAGSLTKNTLEGGAPTPQQVDGLTVHVTYPEGEDLRRIWDDRLNTVASWIASIQMVQQGHYAGFGAFESGLGLITNENADGLEAGLREQFGPIY